MTHQFKKDSQGRKPSVRFLMEEQEVPKVEENVAGWKKNLN